METVAAIVARNVAELRGRRQLSVRGLAALIKPPMLASAVTKIEKGQREVKAEELVSLAVALNVTPSRLLLPEDPSEWIVLPDGRKCSGQAAWRWAVGEQPLGFDEAERVPVTDRRVLAFIRENRPFEGKSSVREVARGLVAREPVPFTAYIEADSAGRVTKARMSWGSGDEEDVDEGEDQ